jgi:hypothetical protein
LAGKKRAAHNAYRHGLSVSLTLNPSTAKQVDKLVRKLAGKTRSEIVLRYARDAAEAALELERIRKFKIALVDRVLAVGSVEPPTPYGAITKSIRRLKLAIAGKIPLEEQVDPLESMPPKEPLRTAEAVRRALPELVKLDRYEARAIGRRSRAIRLLSASQKQ